jgi:hypothetical protein
MIMTLVTHLLNKYKETEPDAKDLEAAQKFCQWAELELKRTPPVLSYGASPGFRVTLRDGATVYLSRQYIEEAVASELPPAHAVGMNVGMGSHDRLPDGVSLDLYTEAKKNDPSIGTGT